MVAGDAAGARARVWPCSPSRRAPSTTRSPARPGRRSTGPGSRASRSSSDWAGLRLSGPPASRAAALAAVDAMPDRDAVARVEYACSRPPRPCRPPAATPTPTPTPSDRPRSSTSRRTSSSHGIGRRGGVLTLSGTLAGEQRHAALLAARAVRGAGGPRSTTASSSSRTRSPRRTSRQAYPAFLRLAGRAAAGSDRPRPGAHRRGRPLALRPDLVRGRGDGDAVTSPTRPTPGASPSAAP